MKNKLTHTWTEVRKLISSSSANASAKPCFYYVCAATPEIPKTHLRDNNGWLSTKNSTYAYALVKHDLEDM